jgi:hypothetical protein
MTARETRDRGWQQCDPIDSFLEDAYDTRQNDDYEGDEPPDDDEFCRTCGQLLDDAGDGWNGYCPNCADARENTKPNQAIEALAQPLTFVFIYDAYVRIEADSKATADLRLQITEQAVDALDGVTLSLFDAYGIEDARTGEELRQVH